MQLTAEQKSIIERVINCFETGKPDGKYGQITIYSDGPHNIRQITYGRSQTTEYGKLRELIQIYVSTNGIYSQQLLPFAEQIGSKPLVDNDFFKDLLRKAGKEDPVMIQVQDQFFDRAYFVPAMNWADQYKFVLPLSALVIYDSFIHSGSILWLIRQKFPENTPADGGDERAWIKAYVRERQKFLANHPNPVVQKTVYRTKDLTREINKGNWDLAMLPFMANGSAVIPKIA